MSSYADTLEALSKAALAKKGAENPLIGNLLAHAEHFVRLLRAAEGLADNVERHMNQHGMALSGLRGSCEDLRAALAPFEVKPLCGQTSPDGMTQCILPKGHIGPHSDREANRD